MAIVILVLLIGLIILLIPEKFPTRFTRVAEIMFACALLALMFWLVGGYPHLFGKW
jgi:hypothetical protein